MKQSMLMLLLSVFSLGYSQREANIWYFGNKAGIDFNSGTPVAISNGQLNTIEGCTSISDHQGNILFYTNGINVWNKNHVMMQNGSGLFGDASSSQAAVIVRKPESATIYYVFTTNSANENGGLRYSIVDMAQNSGVGAVTAKNMLIYESTTEKITVVKHRNGKDIWLVSHQLGGNGFYAHRITAAGMSPSAVLSNTGINVTADSDRAHAIGTMKLSPDGSKLVACHTYLYQAELFDFDNATGSVSNPRTILADGMHAYGAEFSPNGTALFVSAVDEKKIFRYDLTVSDIPGSKTVLANLPQIPGSMQLGPDGKIYIAMAEVDKLSVINQPDATSAQCSVSINAIDLDGRISMLGLPTMNQSLLHTYMDVQTACGNTASFTLHAPQDVNAIVWNFGDNTTSNDINAQHSYAAPGNYRVTATVTTVSGIIAKTQNVLITPGSFAGTISNKFFCIGTQSAYDLSENDSILLNGQLPNAYATAYFASAAAAQNHVNVLPSNYPLSVGTSTIFAKVYKLNDMDCNAVTTFTVTSYLTPVAPEVSDFVTCDNAGNDGIALFDLDTKTTALTNGDSDLTVTYFETQSDADSNTSPIPTLFTNASNSQRIYARIENNNGCFTVASFQLVVNNCVVDDGIDFPKFFTPNGDGYNDVWQMTFKGGTSKTKITIFDRYGKLVKMMTYTDNGWDGTINGQQLPSSDYWYVVNAENGKEYKGHFAMKR